MLKELLSKYENDYCVVGNSPCELGKSNGEKIDSHRLVFRFNDFNLKKKFQKDYGKVANVWVRGTNDKLVYTMEEKKKNLRNFDAIFLRAKDERNKKFRKYCKNNGIMYYVFPIENEIMLTKELGFCPSTGLLTLYNIKKEIGNLELKRIYGFSFCKENRKKNINGKQIHYYNNNDLVNPETGKIENIKNTFLISKHNWSKEEFYFRTKLLRS